MRWHAIALTAFLTLLQCAAWAGKDVAADQLPGAVSEAIKRQFPKGEIVSAERETDHGKVKYEVKVTSEGKTYEVDVEEGGRVIKSEEDDD